MNVIRNIFISMVAVVGISTIASGDVLFRASATGNGVMAVKTKSERVNERQFSFSVQANLDGTISGQATLADPGAESATAGEPYTLDLDITCMHVVDNVAFFGGTTSRTNDPGLVDAAYFSVQDYGNGIDKISRVYFFDDDPNTTGDPQLCMENQPGDFDMEPIASGNISLQ